MATDLNASFNEQFMNINTKLKNASILSSQLSLDIRTLGAAKCEASVGNFLGEAEHLVAAGRQFMKAEKKLSSLKFCSPDRENLEAAIGCFIQALHKYPDNSSIRLSILTEVANHLVELNLKCEAVSYYEQALELVEESNMKIMFMRNYINLLIECDNCDTALEKANELIDSKPNLPEDILAEVQLSRVLLSLYVEPSDEVNTESLKQLLTDILNDVDSEAIPFNADLRLKLQSTIISCATNDTHSLVKVSSELKHHLSTRQTGLLESLLQAKREHLA
ncbi:hypothetical protein MSG28_012989 [Choristoneura fumiferana]|uniref:Uncharacterized protein n=1 Tax=Choristoneura fumiferana TaxID=7141 RepID=A0ACC0KSI9_CHOFU|nr:hypothetical protein MSG28_012989 [Choristoneura fumiferana]